MSSKLSVFFSEMKRRRVYHVAVVYVIVGFGVASGSQYVFEILGFPLAAAQFVAILLVLGLPIALVLAWAYEIRPEEPREVGTSAPGSAGQLDPEAKKSIIVLPFDNMSPDPGDEYFSDGLTEEILTTLSQIRSLRVISRISAMVLKGTEKDVRTIGRELNVQYVLEGSVRKAGDNLRITAQLIDAISDEHLWAEKYDGVLGDVFEIQEKVSRSIVDALRLSLAPEEEERLTERPIEDIQAYELYLMARREIFIGTVDSLEQARRHLETGLEIFGENVTLLQGLAEMYLHLYETGVKDDEETLSEAEDLAFRINSLHPDTAYGHYLKGRIERFKGSSIKAIRHWERAVSIDPNHSSSLIFLFHTYGLQAGRLDLAAALKNKVLEHDPLNTISWLSVAWYHWMKGEFAEVSSCFERITAIVGPTAWADLFGAYLLIWQDRTDEALSLIEKVLQREAPGVLTEWAQWLGGVLRGETVGGPPSEETRRFLWNDPEAVWLAGSTLALEGERVEALTWLEHAVDRGWINYPLFSEQDPLLESLRGEERFKILMEKVEHAWGAFSQGTQASV